MRKIFSEFKKIFARHTLGLPLTTLISAALSGALLFLRWPMHTAFLSAMLREKKIEAHFPDLFFSALSKHALFFLVWIFLILPAIVIVHFVSGFMTIAIGGTMRIWSLSYLALAFFVFFILMHPMAFYLAYSWEIEEKGFVADLKLLLSYVAHYFKRPFSHVLFTLKCYLLYILGFFLVVLPLVLLWPFLILINYRVVWYHAGMMNIFSLVLLGLAFVFSLFVFLLYVCPFFSFTTLKFYEPLAPKPGEEKRNENEAGVPLLEGGETYFWKMTVSYDGTKFCGWQFQLGARTVQGELTAALRRLLLEDVVLTASSRTDSGVHALGQTVCFKTTKDLTAEKLLRGVNSFVPDDISVTKVESVDESFHPTFNAFGKHYQYRVYTAESDDVMTRKYHYWIRRAFDIDAMRKAAAVMVGEREFKGLQVKSGKPNEATLRLITAVDVAASENEIIIDIFGKGFMYKQVRSMVGLLLAVGEGRVKAEEVDSLCSGTAECRKSSVAPPQGLTLVKVYYSKEEFEARS